MKPKVVIIFPKYSPDDSSHYPYWYTVFAKAQTDLDIHMVFETPHNAILSASEAVFPFKNFTFQTLSSKPFNLIERTLIILKLRLQGYTNFYIHYSIWSLFVTKMITTILGGKTYLWDCEYYQKEIPNKLLIKALSLTDVIVTGHQKIADQYRKILELPNKKITIVRNWVIDHSRDEHHLDQSQHHSDQSEPSLCHPERHACRQAGSEGSLSQSKQINILFIHHLSPRKGSRELPGIIQSVIAACTPAISFTIIGTGPDLPWLKQQMTCLNLDQHVTITGRLSHQQTQEYWHQADLMIMPSRSEGFPRVILESQKAGVPYIATDVGCVREISPEAQLPFIIRSNRPDLFAKAIIKYVKNQQKYQNIKAHLLANVEKYSLNSATSEFNTIFHD